MKGYIILRSDWTCDDCWFRSKHNHTDQIHFRVGQTYVFEGRAQKIVPVHQNGFSFYKRIVECCKYFGPKDKGKLKVVEIKTIGNVEFPTPFALWCAASKIKIIREVPWDELVETTNLGSSNTGLLNTGDDNSGNSNTGFWNSGDYNVGNYNSGYSNGGANNSGEFNTGDFNSGDFNVGDGNIGGFNSGMYNSGTYNSGNHNSGCHNSGDWNSGFNSNGCFCTTYHTIPFFNKPSSLTYDDWLKHPARRILDSLKPCIWIKSGDMTEEEKAEHPSWRTTGGYLKTVDVESISQNWWNDLDETSRNHVLSIPNFDAVIFRAITGIDVNAVNGD